MPSFVNFPSRSDQVHTSFLALRAGSLSTNTSASVIELQSWPQLNSKRALYSVPQSRQRRQYLGRGFNYRNRVGVHNYPRPKYPTSQPPHSSRVPLQRLESTSPAVRLNWDAEVHHYMIYDTIASIRIHGLLTTPPLSFLSIVHAGIVSVGPQIGPLP
jgi:hypothetical protein